MNFSKIMYSLSMFFGPGLYYRLAYLHHRKRFPNLKHPQDIVEVWISKILSNAFAPYSGLADKYKVRDYVSSKGLSKILPELLGVWDRAEDIDFDRLPERFVLKTNNGCSTNIICRNKSNLDKKKAVTQLNTWLQLKFDREKHYNTITPRIIGEEFIQDGVLPSPIDYKFYCIHGEPIIVMVCSERSKKGVKFFAYDLQWNPRPDWIYTKESASFRKPKHFEQMLEYAKILSEEHDVVRVDFYDTDEQIYFGEMTFTPEGGLTRYFTDSAIRMLGRAYLQNKKKC